MHGSKLGVHSVISGRGERQTGPAQDRSMPANGGKRMTGKGEEEKKTGEER